jgi:hypothetical protein
MSHSAHERVLKGDLAFLNASVSSLCLGKISKVKSS